MMLAFSRTCVRSSRRFCVNRQQTTTGQGRGLSSIGGGFMSGNTASHFTTDTKKWDPNPYGSSGRSRMLLEEKGDYDTIRSAFTFPEPEYYNIGVDISDKHSGSPDNVAIIYETEEGDVHNTTFKELIESSDALANALVTEYEVGVGDRVALLMSQAPETAISHTAVYKTGAIAVPLFVLFGPEALEYRLNNSGAKVLIVEPSRLDEILTLQKTDKLPALERIIVAPPLSSKPEVNTGYVNVHEGVELFDEVLAANEQNNFKAAATKPDDPALIIYTSGTTGNPKGALHGHRVLLGHLPGVEYPQDFFPQENDLFWTPADWAWIGGLLDGLLPSLHHGVPVLARRFKKFTAEGAFELIAKHKVKNMFQPPTALKMMAGVKNPELTYDLQVRSIGSGGEALGTDLLDWGKKTFGLTINEFYGQTECNLMLGNCSESFPVIQGSMGRSIPGHTVEIVDNAGVPVPKGTVGNIGVKAPHPVMFLEYWNNPQATADKYQNGYLLTGDLGKEEDNGYFYFFGRDDDVITSSGYRIGPAEIENCLLEHPAVQNAAVIGAPCPIRTELVKAFIILQPQAADIDEAELRSSIQEHVGSRLARYEYPREVEFVTDLPMTTTGKIIRGELRKAELAKHENSD